MKRKWIFTYHRSPDGGGGGLGPSLSDIISGTGDGVKDITDPPAGGDDPVEGTNPDGTLQEGYVKDDDGKVVKDPNAGASGGKAEGLNDDGTLQPGYKKDEQGNVVPDPEYKEEEELELEEGDYYEEVEKIAGFKVTDGVEYPEGIKAGTPESRDWLTTPEGTTALIKANREAAANDFEAYLKEKNPRGYAFLLHLEAGGTEEDFFNDNRGLHLPSLEQLTASADVQAALLKHDLLIRGLDEETAQLAVDKAIKDNKLLERSTAVYRQMDEAQKKQLADLQKQRDTADTKFRTDLAAMTNRLARTIKEELSFHVPEPQQAQLQKFITDNMQYDDQTGKFYVTQEIGTEGFKTLVESLLFQFKKGDLKDLVTKQSKTVAAQRLRLKVKGTEGGPGSGSDTTRSQSKHLPLSAILPGMQQD